HPHNCLGQTENCDHCSSITDIEALSNRGRILETTHEALDEIIDVTPCADLCAVAVDVNRFVVESSLDEDLNRSLSRLARAVNVEWPDGHDRQAILRVIGKREMFSGEFAH